MSEIIFEANFDKRTKVLKKMIKLSNECLNLNNISAALAGSYSFFQNFHPFVYTPPRNSLHRTQSQKRQAAERKLGSPS